jgi:predicted nucleic acid-binding protein
MKPLHIVLDTNIMLVCISSRSSLHGLFQALIDGKLFLYLTTDILAEYEEIISQHMGKDAAEDFLAVMHHLPNVKFIQTYLSLTC